MIMDYFIVGALTVGWAIFLNKKYFDENPASSSEAYKSAIGVFIFLTVILTALMHYRNSITKIESGRLIDFKGIGLAIIFYLALNKKKKIS
jgi:hypothetical protein